MERKLNFTADMRHENKILRNVLLSEFSLSRKLITKLKRTPGGIRVNQEDVYVTRRLHTGDLVELILEEGQETSSNVVAVEGPLRVLYEDADILVVDKGAGIPVHPSQNHYASSLGNFVAYYYVQRGESLVFRPVNRLDKDTSGLVLIAKNAHSGHLLHEQTKEGKIKKEYTAVVQGITPAEGIIDLPIGRCAGSTIKREVRDGGKRAVTLYTRIAAAEGMSLLRVVTQTGRTHQIRVHLAHIGHPLVGDFLYGKEEAKIIPRHALHAGHMVFFHPISHESMAFDSPLPEDMQKLAPGGAQ
jgi:23S rRNA pseudouridine1911/1915/1917 synthase